MTKLQADMATWETEMDELISREEEIDDAVFKKYGTDFPDA